MSTVPAKRAASPSLRRATPQAKWTGPTECVPVGVPVVQVLGDALECAPCDAEGAEEADPRNHRCNQPGCAYKSKQAGHLKQHLAGVHGIGVVWHPCLQPGCHHQTKQACHLKQHLAFAHDIGVVWHPCPQPDCDHKSKQASALKQHLADAHGIGVVWHHCPQPGCDHKAKQAGNLGQHLADAHGIGVVWHPCPQPGCDYKAKKASNIKRHLADAHGIGVVWHRCPQPDCNYKSKAAGNLKQHLAHAHGIGVVWHRCPQPDCNYKSKAAGNLKRHLADAHDIGVVWHACDAAPGECHYACKTASDLHRHIRRMHFRVYAQRKCAQEERVRQALRAADWQEHHLAEAMPPVGHFRREKRIDFKCAKLDTAGANARIDFVLGVPNGYVFLEVDEHQHQYGYDALISCDMKRMSHVMESLAVETGGHLPCIYWLRYNPHAWRVGGEVCTVPKAEREARLVAWLEGFECVAPLGIGYAFYDCEAEEDGGTLAVLDNEEFSPHYAEVVDNLLDLR